MRKLLFSVLLLTLCSLKAQMVVEAPGVEGLLSSQVSQLTELIAEEKFGNSQFMTEYLPKVIQTLDGINAILDTSRKIHTIYESVKDYSTEKLTQDMEDGACAAFPGTCPTIKNTFGETFDNINMIRKGDKKFWTYRSQWSHETDSFVTKMAQGSMMAYVYPKVAPNVSKFWGYDNGPQDIYEVFEYSLAESGLSKIRNFEHYQAAMINVALKKFLDEADEKKNLEAQGIGILAGQNQGMSRDISDIKSIILNRHLNEIKERMQAETEYSNYVIEYMKYKEKMKEEEMIEKDFE